MNEFNKVLHQFNMGCQEVTGTERSGKEIHGITFFPLDEKGKRAGLTAISGSRISNQFSYPKLMHFFDECKKEEKKKKEVYKKKKENVARQINRVLNKYREGISYDDFNYIMNANGIDTIYSINNNGRLLGVSFVDNVSGLVFKLSDLDKETQEKLRNALSEEKHLSSKELKDQIMQISPLLRDLYDKEKKENYYFESDLIRELEDKREKFATMLSKDSVFAKEAVDAAIDNYFDFKKQKLSETEEKERGYFEKSVKELLDQSSHFNDIYIGELFKKCNIVWDGKTFRHIQGDRITYTDNTRRFSAKHRHTDRQGVLEDREDGAAENGERKSGYAQIRQCQYATSVVQVSQRRYDNRRKAQDGG